MHLFSSFESSIKSQREEDTGRLGHTSLSKLSPLPVPGDSWESLWAEWTAEIKALSAPGRLAGGWVAASGARHV